MNPATRVWFPLTAKTGSEYLNWSSTLSTQAKVAGAVVKYRQWGDKGREAGHSPPRVPCQPMVCSGYTGDLMRYDCVVDTLMM